MPVVQEGDALPPCSETSINTTTIPPLSIPATSSIQWQDGVGTLPGTELKFKYNEFGLLEVADLGGGTDLLSLPTSSRTDGEKISCGDGDVKSPEFPQQKRKRLEDVIKEIDRKHSSVANTKSPSQLHCDSSFITIVSDFRNRFMVGERLEAVDNRNPSQFCAVTVTRVRGHRLRLHLDGFSTNFDFWVNAYSPFIKPVGYCKANDKNLQPPKGFDSSGFQWTGYLQMNAAKAAQEESFHKYIAKYPVPKTVSPGMRLEATHPTNDSELNFRAATVHDILDDQYLLIHLDGSKECDDFWVELNSPFIRALSRPSILAVPSEVFQKRPPLNFEINMPVECVDPANQNSIVRGTLLQHEKHRLFIRVEEIDDGVSFFWLPEDSCDIYPWGFCQRMGFQIHKTSGKSVADSRSVKRQKVAPLPPLLISEGSAVSQSVSSEHTLPKNDQQRSSNSGVISPTITAVVQGAGSLSSPNVAVSAVPCTSAAGLDLSPGADCNDDDGEDEQLDEEDMPTEDLNKNVASSDNRKKKKAKRKKYLLSMPPKGHKSGMTKAQSKTKLDLETGVLDDDSFEQDMLVDPVHKSVFAVEPELQPKNQSPCWEQVLSKALIPTLSLCKCDDVKLWSVEKVADFVKSLPGCTAEHGRIFKEEQIDGEALLLMNQNDIIDLLHIKLGPALKIYNCIAYFASVCQSGSS